MAEADPAPPWGPEEERRIRLTTAVADTDGVPKVEGAGEVFDRDGTPVQRMHNGVLVEAGGYHGDWMVEIIRRLRGHHEPQEEVVFHAMVERLRSDGRAATMIELGAFWSYYSLWLRHAVPQSRNVLVEPDPLNLALGRRNFALNGFDGDFVEAAVGEHGGAVHMDLETLRRPRRVATVSPDGLADDRGLDRVDLMLIDVQGAELRALSGARHLIEGGRLRFVVVSTHDLHIGGDPLLHHACLDFVRAHGGHVIAEHGVYESCSGDGLIAASFDPADRDMRVPVTIVRAQDSLLGAPEFELAAMQRRVRRLERLLGISAVRDARRFAGLRIRGRHHGE